jgi:hypothetical protein
MITTKETGDLLEAHVYNEFVLADYKEFEQAVGRELRKAPKIRLLLDFTSMIDYTIDVAWEEIKFTRAHAHDFKRIAVVTPGEWAPWLAWVSAAFTDAAVRIFEDENTARAWLNERIK